MTLDIGALANPKEIAERIYAERYRADYESKYPGQFAAINVSTGDAFVAISSEQAIQNAKKASPNGLFHVIGIAVPEIVGMGRVSLTGHNWIYP